MSICRSVYPPIADIARRGWHGRKVPNSDIGAFKESTATRTLRFGKSQNLDFGTQPKRCLDSCGEHKSIIYNSGSLSLGLRCQKTLTISSGAKLATRFVANE